MGNDPLRRERIGQQLSALDPVADVLQNLPQLRVFLPLDQQFERVQNGQSGPNQRQKLLVKDQKRVLLQLASSVQANLPEVSMPRGLTE